MGSCVPPRDCAGKITSFRRPPDAGLIETAFGQVDVEIGQLGADATVDLTLKFDALDALARDYWNDGLTGARWETSEEEDTRTFMLERLIAQSLEVKKIVTIGQPSKLHVSWQGDTSAFIEEAIPAAQSRTRNSTALTDNKEANDQIQGFANYLYRAVRDELGEDDARIESIIALIGTCLEGVGNVVYVAKSLTGLPRPPHPRRLPTPRISTWPGGHAYFSGVIATILYVLVTRGLVGTEQAKVQYRKRIFNRLATMAQRISTNRERAALHFVEDSKVGLEWGFKVMDKVLRVAMKTSASSTATNPPGTLRDLHTLILQVA